MSNGLVACLGLLIGGVGGICSAIVIDYLFERGKKLEAQKP